MSVRLITRKELDALPVREWAKTTVYDSVMLCPSTKLHDSGWRLIKIIGCNKSEPVEVAVLGCDHIEWKSRAREWGDGYIDNDMQMDCATVSRCVHFWSRTKRFKVSAALSSVTIELVEEKQ